MLTRRPSPLIPGVFALCVLTAPSAHAVTANLCLRNDGVGTFDNSDLSLFAMCTPASGNRTDSGPGSGLGPGASTCLAMTGLSAWNGYQYTYVFEIDFMDSTGVVTVTSASGLELGSGSNYITANGVSTSAGSSAAARDRGGSSPRRRRRMTVEVTRFSWTSPAATSSS